MQGQVGKQSYVVKHGQIEMCRQIKGGKSREMGRQEGEAGGSNRERQGGQREENVDVDRYVVVGSQEGKGRSETERERAIRVRERELGVRKMGGRSERQG